MRKILNKIAIALSLSNKISAEEQLELLNKEEKHDNLLSDIRHIRNSGYYVPDYDKPNPHAILACPRPVDFGNDVEAWINAVRKENTFDSNSVEKKEKAFQEIMQKRYLNIDIFINKFMKVD
ncbi:MAG TPA: hypothetical protein VMX17_09650 [Candidatus Glassbacteria bacterium]|nr:hypothetical protein [Candidatus Glassbacteria bacterium]